MGRGGEGGGGAGVVRSVRARAARQPPAQRCCWHLIIVAVLVASRAVLVLASWLVLVLLLTSYSY